MAGSKAAITSQGFVKVVPDFSIDDAPPPDVLVIPGGNSRAVSDDPRFFA